MLSLQDEATKDRMKTMSNELGTKIATHMQKDGSGWGVRIGQLPNGSYVVQRLAPHPVYKRETAALPVAYAKTETEAREAANKEWLAQKDNGPVSKRWTALSQY